MHLKSLTDLLPSAPPRQHTDSTGSRVASYAYGSCFPSLLPAHWAATTLGPAPGLALLFSVSFMDPATHDPSPGGLNSLPQMSEALWVSTCTCWRLAHPRAQQRPCGSFHRWVTEA